MSNMTAKFLGWVLLAGGLAVIAWALWSSYQIFTGSQDAPDLFKIESKESPKPAAKPKTEQELLQSVLQEQLQSALPLGELGSRLLNLIAWATFAGILILGGGKISSIGAQLIR